MRIFAEQSITSPCACESNFGLPDGRDGFLPLGAQWVILALAQSSTPSDGDYKTGHHKKLTHQLAHMKIQVKDSTLQAAASQGMDAFILAVVDGIKAYVGGELTEEAFQVLSPDHITLWGYVILRDELCDGGFIQLIHNGYGPFFFFNPFAKAMRLWGLKEFSKFIYRARELYETHREALEQEMSDEEFMALYEQYPEFDDLDDEFIANEEEITSLVAHYLDNHLLDFVEIVK